MRAMRIMVGRFLDWWNPAQLLIGKGGRVFDWVNDLRQHIVVSLMRFADGPK